MDGYCLHNAQDTSTSNTESILIESGEIKSSGSPNRSEVAAIYSSEGAVTKITGGYIYGTSNAICHVGETTNIGKVYIYGGTIESGEGSAVLSNAARIIYVGDKDVEYDAESVLIKSNSGWAVETDGFYFYNGTIKGKNDPPYSATSENKVFKRSGYSIQKTTTQGLITITLKQGS